MIGIAGIFFKSGTSFLPILQTPFITSQVYPSGQQWTDSPQQTAFWMGQQPKLPLLRAQQVESSWQLALPTGHWFSLAWEETTKPQSTISTVATRCIICTKKYIKMRRIFNVLKERIYISAHVRCVSPQNKSTRLTLKSSRKIQYLCNLRKRSIYLRSSIAFIGLFILFDK